MNILVPRKPINLQLIQQLRELTIKHATYKDKVNKKAILETAKIGINPSLTLYTNLDSQDQSLTLKKGSHTPKSALEPNFEYLSYSLPATRDLKPGTLLIDSRLTHSQPLSFISQFPTPDYS